MNRSGIEINTWSLDSNYSPEHVKCIEMQHQPFWFCILPWCAWTWNRASVDIIKHYITQTQWKPILQLLVFMHFTVQWGNNFKSLLDLILRIHPVDGHGEPQCCVPLQIHLKNRGEVFDLFIQLADPTCAIGFVTVAPLAHYVTGWDCWEGGSWLRCDRFQPNGSKWWFGLWCFSNRVAPPNWPYFISYFNTCEVAVDVEKDSVKSGHCQTFKKRFYRLADLFPYTHLGETKPKMAHQDSDLQIQF